MEELIDLDEIVNAVIEQPLPDLPHQETPLFPFGPFVICYPKQPHERKTSRPTYVREYRVVKNGREYVKKATLPVPGTGGVHTGRPVEAIDDATIARVRQLRADRYTLRDINSMTGVSHTKINKILNHSN